LPADKPPQEQDGSPIPAPVRVTAFPIRKNRGDVMRNWLQLRYSPSRVPALLRRRDERARLQSRACGFTLIELMIVLVIVGILAAIAFPSYMQYPRRSARAEAQSYLSDVAALQQQYLVDKRSYAPSLSSLGRSPTGNVASKFAVTVVAADGPPPAFVITAQATGDQLKDACPTLAIDNVGNRTPVSCW
jgi:type IV pilus assembly protein PilE